MLHRISALVGDEDGATAIEYGLIAALVAIALIAGVSYFGSAMTNMYDELANTVLAASS